MQIVHQWLRIRVTRLVEFSSFGLIFISDLKKNTNVAQTFLLLFSQKKTQYYINLSIGKVHEVIATEISIFWLRSSSVTQNNMPNMCAVFTNVAGSHVSKVAKGKT
jgi:hypothetical protein